MQQRWEDPAWVATAHGWIADRLGELGLNLTGEIEQPHVRDWATAMRVPTDAGDLWFKANAEVLAFEAGLVAVLAERRPDVVPPLLAADPDSGWINYGCYRIQSHAPDRATVFMSPGKHGRIIMGKYHERKQPCPVAC